MKSKDEIEKLSKHSLQCEVWMTLTDIEKSFLLLGSSRLTDHEQYIHEYESWEGPDYTFPKSDCNTIKTAIMPMK